MIMIGKHRAIGPGMAQQTRAYPCIFHGDHIRQPQDFGGTWRKVSEVADRPCDDVKPWLKP